MTTPGKEILSWEKRVRIASFCFIFAAVFFVLAMAYNIFIDRFTSIDPYLAALLVLVVVAPTSLLISIKLYRDKFLPLLEKRGRNDGYN
jgi:hypothetical protein